jgi:hypothetical protein
MIPALLALVISFSPQEAPRAESRPATRPDGEIVPGPPLIPLNGRPLAPGSSGSWSFLVGGHLYGRPSPDPGPSSTFVRALGDLRTIPDAFFVSLGDFVYQSLVPASALPSFGALSLMTVPVFNAPGNHDFANRAAYVAWFGEGFGATRYRDALILVLNTELEPWSITKEQLAAVRRSLKWALEHEEIRQVFVFMHKVLFATADPRFEPLFQWCNARDGWTGASNFGRDVWPLLVDLARTRHVACFSGDFGASLNVCLDRHPESGVVVVCTGLWDRPPDAFVRVSIDPKGATDYALVPIGGGELRPIREYSIEYWRDHLLPPK